MVFHSAIPVLAAKDVEAAVAFFTDVLGFVADFVWGTPPAYASVTRDRAEIHFNTDGQAGVPARVAIVVDDVDAYHDEVVAKGAEVVEPLGDQVYGMRDFTVRTPDGHLLSFGQSTVD